jgi:hypothetical protein
MSEKVKELIAEVDKILDRDLAFFHEKKLDQIQNEILPIKTLPYEEKLQVVEHVVSRSNILNVNMIYNISLLVITGQQYSADFFESENVWFESIVELIDMRVALESYITKLITQLIEAFIDVLGSQHITPEIEGMSPNFRFLEPTYHMLLMTMNFYTLSPLFAKLDKETLIEQTEYHKEKPYIYGAKEILLKFIGEYKLSDEILKMFEKSNGSS